MNDSGKPELFGLDAEGNVTATVQVAGARVTDWEDVSVGPCPAGSCVYLADIGDNRRGRQDVEFYRFPEPAPGDRTSATPDILRATYADGPHDAESAFVTGAGQVFVITKEHPAVLYRLENSRLTRVSTVSPEPAVGKHLKRTKVTDADASPDGKWLAVRTGDGVGIYPLHALISGKNPTPMFVPLGELAEPQGEGVALTSNGTLYLVGEGAGTGNVKRGSGTFASVSCKLTS